MEIIAVRHTKLDIKPGICYGISDVLPASSFKKDAVKVRKTISDLKVNAIYSSPSTRCTLLAKECGFDNFYSDDRLLELNFGKWEMAPWHTITGECADNWFNDYINFRCPDGESLMDLIQRVENYIEELGRLNYNSTLCFTHSGPIRAFHHLINNLPLANLFDVQIEFGGVYTFQF